MELPVYELKLKDEANLDGVFAISIVKEPAIEENFIAMSKEFVFSSHDDDKRIITGLAMIPDIPILRIKDGEKFFVKFSKDTIREVAARFMERSDNYSVTIEHEKPTSKASIIESWIIEDESNDKMAALGLHSPVGAWAVSMRIHDDEMWDKAKNGDLLNGFSIEGFFDRELIINSAVITAENDELMQEQIDALKEQLDALIAKVSEMSEPKETDEEKVAREAKEKEEQAAADGQEKEEKEEMMSKISKLQEEITAMKAEKEAAEKAEADAIAEKERLEKEEETLMSQQAEKIEKSEWNKFKKSLK